MSSCVTVHWMLTASMKTRAENFWCRTISARLSADLYLLAGRRRFSSLIMKAFAESKRLPRSEPFLRQAEDDQVISADAGVNIFNPFSSRPNPDYDPSRPISRTNPQIFRDPFPNNVIPQNLLSPAAATMLKKYVPRPNSDNMGAIIMNGVPSVVGAGNDANNFLDQRNARYVTDQGTLRIDRVFDRGDTLSARFSVGKEDGFMPQNLPGFGLNHDNLSQHANIGWTRILSPTLVNSASIAYSRLAMTHFEENSFTNDIVGELGIQGVGFGGARAWGAPYFNIQGYSGFGDTFQATPMQSWDTVLEGRDAVSWQHGRHSIKFGVSYRRFIWPMWAYVQSRGYYQFTNGYTTQTATNDGTGSALASFELALPAVRQRQVGSPRMNLRQWYADAVRPGHVADLLDYHDQHRAAL